MADLTVEELLTIPFNTLTNRNNNIRPVGNQPEQSQEPEEPQDQRESDEDNEVKF